MYSAPEVLKGEEYSFPIDVYSFAICLWEIITKRDPFIHLNHNDDYDTFVDYIVNKKERPVLQDVPLQPPGLRELIAKCWNEQPKDRENFSEIVSKLRKMQIDAAIKDLVGQNFWENSFQDLEFVNKHKIPVNDFVRKFYEYISNSVDLELLLQITEKAEKLANDPTNKYRPLITPGDGTSSSIGGLSSNANEMGALIGSAGNLSMSGMDIDSTKRPPTNDDISEYKCLVELLSPAAGNQAKPLTKDRYVTITDFGNMLDWFGPLDMATNKKDNILVRIRETLKLTYFHGHIGNAEANRRLATLPNGSFLVRFSGESGKYVLSRIVGGGFTEGRIIYTPGKGFCIPGSVTYCKSLSKFIVKHHQKLNLKKYMHGIRI